MVTILAERVRNIKPSATLTLDAKAKQLKKEGKDVIIFRSSGINSSNKIEIFKYNNVLQCNKW